MASNLYPPILDSYLPAFCYFDEQLTVPFTVSPYQSVNTNVIQYSIVEQSTNQTILISNRPVIFKYINNNSFTINLKEDLMSGILQPEKIYKLQVRFDITENIENIKDNNNQLLMNNHTDIKFLNQFLSKNINNFSEWSTVCLLYPIYQPVLTLNNFEDGDSPSFPLGGNAKITGYLQFKNENQQIAPSAVEILKAYRFNIYTNTEEPELIFTGQEIYPITTNQINDYIYIPKIVDPQDSTQFITNFILETTYTTKKGYIKTEQNTFVAQEDNITPITFEVQVVNENGYIEVKTLSNTSAVGWSWYGYLHVQRADNKHNFQNWTTIHTFFIDYDQIEDFISSGRSFVDNSVCSLMGYKYSVQFENNKGLLFNPTYTNDIYIPNFEGPFFSSDEGPQQHTQVKISFDYKISSSNRVSNRSKLEPLGSKYPKFAENALLDYKTFSISGTISTLDNANHIDDYLELEGEIPDQKYRVVNPISNIKDLFMPTRTEAFGVDFSKKYYDYDNQTSSIYENIEKKVYKEWNLYHDDLWEREYRERLANWLNNGKPKLYRTKTEGNIAVILSDVALTPNDALGRTIYSFSATMTEVTDGYDLEALNDADIFIIGCENNGVQLSATQVIENQKRHICQDHFSALGEEETYFSFRDQILQKYNKLYKGNTLLSYIKKNTLVFTDVKIIFNNLEDANEIKNKVYFDKTASEAYHINVVFNGTQNKDEQDKWISFDINNSGYIQFPTRLEIYDIQIPQNRNCTVEYVMSYSENVETQVLKNLLYSTQIIGQESLKSNVQDNIVKNIFRKYSNAQYKTVSETGQTAILNKTYLNYIYKTRIESEPHTLFLIGFYDSANSTQESEEDRVLQYQLCETGNNGMLNTDSNIEIVVIYYIGRKFYQAATSLPREWEYQTTTQNTHHFFDAETSLFYYNDIQDVYQTYSTNTTIAPNIIIANDDTSKIVLKPVNVTITYCGNAIKKVFANDN